MNRTAVVHDYLLVPGGAEKVVLEFSRVLGSDLVVGYSRNDVISLLDYNDIRVNNLFNYLPYRLSWAISIVLSSVLLDRRFDRYNSIIYSGVLAPLLAKRHSPQFKIMYIHTVPRIAFMEPKRRSEKFGSVNAFVIDKLLNKYLTMYEDALSSMNVIYSNSHHTADKLRCCYGRESQVLYPPCDTGRYKYREEQGYYLSLARLEPYKRVHRIVKAFLRMPSKTLVVASGGSELKHLQFLAGDAPNIIFKNWLKDEELLDLMSKCIATIYIPEDEDFGMSVVDSIASGKPVIGVSEGGIKEIIIDDETGILLPPDPSVEDIEGAILAMSSSKAKSMRTSCEERAEMFGLFPFTDALNDIKNKFDV
tara:strand:- start:170 stop:1261 length:1092 start_codon:yes stop_codon:yes gene_type:complete